MSEQTEAQSPVPPLNPDLAGYPDTQSLVHGYRESGAEAKRQRERAEKAEQALSSVLLQGQANPRQQVPDRRLTPEDRLSDLGIPVDAVREVVSTVVQEALAPLTRGVQARGQMVSRNPDYVQFENEVAAFIEQDPELSRSYPALFQADPGAAMEYAFLKFGDSRRRVHPHTNGERTGVGDAAIPTLRAGDGRGQAPGDTAVQEAFERFQRTGSSADAQAYARARLGPVIKEQFRRQGQDM